jgi:carboxymethylenebutenolidase
MPRSKATIHTRDGSCEASIFTPNTGAGPWPAVLFFMDGRGIRPALFEMGERLASAGYYVLLPDLFYRAGPYQTPPANIFTGDPEARQRWISTYMATASHANVRSDTEAFLAFLSEQRDVASPRIGVTGYCMGGGLALAAAAHFPERVVAAASYHGGFLATDAPDSPHRLADRIKARVYVAGAVQDASFPEEQKRRLTEALVRARVDHKVETYEGARHGWVPSDSSVHHPEAAERHWRTLIGLLKETLSSSAQPVR